MRTRNESRDGLVASSRRSARTELVSFECRPYAYAEATIDLVPGTNTLFSSIEDMSANPGSASKTFYFGARVNPVATNLTAGQSSSDSAFFIVQNTSTTSRTFTLSSTCSGTLSECAASPSSVTLDPWGVSLVKATYSTGTSTGSGTVSFTATNGSVTHAASAPITVVTGSRNLVTNWTVHNYDNVQPALRAANCFDARYAISTVPYISLDQPRSVMLSYNSASVAVRPIVSVDVNRELRR